MCLYSVVLRMYYTVQCNEGENTVLTNSSCTGYVHIILEAFERNFLNQACRPARLVSLKINHFCADVCVCVCVSAPEAMNN